MTESANNTVVVAGSGSAITDQQGNNWTISEYDTVLVNNKPAAFTALVAEIAYVNHTVWHENTASEWYSWTGSGWVSGQNPLPTTNTVILEAIAALSDQITAFETYTMKELTTMSSTLGTELSTAEAQAATDQQAETAAIAGLTTAVSALVAAFQGAAPGSPITQAQIDAITAVDTQIQANTAAVTAETGTVTSDTPAAPAA
jgi:hypothetical protein